MPSPRFSVIIPAYNQAQFIAATIRSVLEQTFGDFEIIVINDASPDNTGDVVAQFSDPRVRYIFHETNKGLPGARNTGLLAASGELIALLDADDLFHPEKLATHQAFLNSNPAIDVTYNARFDLHHSSNEIRTIYQPPASVTLKDILSSFQFTPSDIVFRRKCLDDVGLFDERLVCGGEDLDYPCRLALGGKKFSRVEKVLNYRRYHSGRKRGKLACRIDDYTNAVNGACRDPRYPREYGNLRPRALASHYTEVACWALCQEEYGLGNDVLREIQRLNPAALSGSPAPFVGWLMRHTIRDWHYDHEELLTKVFANLNPEFQKLSVQLPWAITTGYLQRGMNELIWNRPDIGLASLEKAKQRRAAVRQPFLKKLVAQLVLIRSELGQDAAMAALARLEKPMYQLGGNASVRYLLGSFAFNSAFVLYRARKYRDVPQELRQAARYWPGFLVNKGFYAVMVKSLLQGRA
jgi:glycosyltransferase involved in cell wall biosynthesis